MKTTASKSALIVRAFAFFAIAWFVVVSNATAPTATAQSAEATPSAPRDAHSIRSADEAASATLALAHAAKVRGPGDIDFDLLRETTLKLEPPPVYPPDLGLKDGKRVTIRGFMTPYDSLKDFKNFMLFPNATGCYFCSPPSPKEVVFIRLKTKDPVSFVSVPIEVTGTLSLWKADSKDDAHQTFLYVMDDCEFKKIEG